MKLEAAPAASGDGGLLAAALVCYRTSLLDMGKSGYLACPASGGELQTSLQELERTLGKELSREVLQATSSQVSEKVLRFGEATAEHLKGKAQEVKDLLMMLASTAESLGERDQRYAKQLHEFTDHLRAVANLEDLTQVRSSLVKTANELKTCVEQMKQDSQETIAQLECRVSNYQNKLKEAEDLALRDPLTSLPNRLLLERRMEFRVENRQPFSVAFLDLNEFKVVNDRYGHTAGDSLLKQFSEELRSNVRPSDLVGRWGGDEFVVLLDCDLAAAAGLMERVKKWVFGDYTIIEGSEKKARVTISAAVGMAEWHTGETTSQVVSRADRAMYSAKRQVAKAIPD
jgi:diguanylate cyclase